MSDSPPAFPRNRFLLVVLAAFAAYATLAIILTFPLILNLSSQVPKDLADSLWYPTILWWNAHVQPLTERWWNGFAFFPATGMMAFSDHLLGASLIASPLQWLGFNPIAAHNLTFLLSFPLCAIAAHVLAWTLTRRHDAALVCGLAYGFSPYRVAHLEHLELLLAFGMPLALAALHVYRETGRAKWLAAFSAALAVQALSASYYALFFTVLVAMWVIWFLRPREWRRALAIVGSGLAVVLALLPIAIGYSGIHRGHALTRDFAEVLAYSADLTSLLTASPSSALWGWTASLNGAERQLFPGLTIIVLAVLGVVVLRRSGLEPHETGATAMSRRCLAIASVLAAVALWAYVGGPLRIDWGWLDVSVSAPYKPLSLALAFALGAIALSPTLRQAFRERSTLAFYLVASVVLFLCSLGPRPTLLGERILYEAPYAWLMRLPLFADSGLGPSVRVPARFAMVAILALSVVGSLTVARLTPSHRRRSGLVVAALAGLMIDGWIQGMALATPQRGYQVPPGIEVAAVLELPLGDTQRDTGAMYRAMLHGRPTVNGYHSYAPLSYQLLKLALADRDRSALEALASFGPLLIVVDNSVDTDRPWASFVASLDGVERLRDEGDLTLFRLPSMARPEVPCAGDVVAVQGAFDEQGEVSLSTVTDRIPATRWITAQDQRVGDVLVLDLGGVSRPCALTISLGAQPDLYPRTLHVETSVDNVTWETTYLGKFGGSAFLAALKNPRDVQIVIPLRGTAARFVSLSTQQAVPGYPWAVADVAMTVRREGFKLSPASAAPIVSMTGAPSLRASALD